MDMLMSMVLLRDSRVLVLQSHAHADAGVQREVGLVDPGDGDVAEPADGLAAVAAVDCEDFVFDMHVDDHIAILADSDIRDTWTRSKTTATWSDPSASSSKRSSSSSSSPRSKVRQPHQSSTTTRDRGASCIFFSWTAPSSCCPTGCCTWPTW